MAAANRNRDAQMTPDSKLVKYTGAVGAHYYAGTYIMVAGGTIVPAAAGAGASGAKLLGVIANEVDISGGVGASNAELMIYKEGVFSMNAQGTGTSAHIGARAYIIDDNTVGVSVGFPALYAGEITGLQTTGIYRVRIDQAINAPYIVGLSGFNYLG